MEALFAICGKDYVITASDDLTVRSIVVMKHGEDKSRQLNKHNLMIFSGEAGDSVQFAEYVQKNIQLYGIKNGVPLATKAISHFVRRELADALRTRNAYHVNLMIAGVDPKTGTPAVFWMDHLANMIQLPFAVQGYGSYFCNATMDRYYHKDMTLEEGIALLKKCIAELQIRFVGNFKEFLVKVVDKDGVREIKI